MQNRLPYFSLRRDQHKRGPGSRTLCNTGYFHFLRAARARSLRWQGAVIVRSHQQSAEHHSKPNAELEAPRAWARRESATTRTIDVWNTRSRLVKARKAIWRGLFLSEPARGRRGRRWNRAQSKANGNGNQTAVHHRAGADSDDKEEHRNSNKKTDEKKGMKNNVNE